MIIHIGYHKTASTWLQKVVFCENNGFYQPVPMSALYSHVVKPSDFGFNEDKVKACLDQYMLGSDKDLVSVLSHERFCGDPFTGSRDSACVAERLYKLYPDARVLIFIRNQTDMIASLYKTYVLQGGRATITDFLNPIENEVNQWFDKSSFNFHYLIEHYHSLFGRDNIMVIPFEMLRKDKQGMLGKIQHFSHIKTKHEVDSSDKRVNVGLSERSIEVLRWGNKLFSPLSLYGLDLARVSGWRIFRSIVFRMDKVLRLLPVKNDMKVKVEACCEGFYEESNTVVQEYVDYDLSKLGYKLHTEKFTP